MNKKCSKYEGYFLFSDEKTLEEHLKECPECRNEREKEEKLSLLLKDSKWEYKRLLKKRLSKSYAKIACVLVLFAGLSTTTGYNIYNHNHFLNKTVYNSADYLSVTDSSGLPTDEYGFFDYN